MPLAARKYVDLLRLDPTQVLSRQIQLDVANQLASESQHQQAAEAYELFLRQFPTYDSIEHVQLILGLLYARYLNNNARATELLRQAVKRLHSTHDIELARAELERLASQNA